MQRGQSGGQLQGNRRLTDAALVVDDRDYFAGIGHSITVSAASVESTDDNFRSVRRVLLSYFMLTSGFTFLRSTQES
jgi:hypothetical protein